MKSDSRRRCCMAWLSSSTTQPRAAMAQKERGESSSRLRTYATRNPLMLVEKTKIQAVRSNGRSSVHSPSDGHSPGDSHSPTRPLLRSRETTASTSLPYAEIVVGSAF